MTDLPTLIAAVLHDTIEDTRTTPEELEALFGPEVRSLVLEVTDDKRLPKLERKRLQIEHAPLRSAKAKLIKLGDKIANVRDVTHCPPGDWDLARSVSTSTGRTRSCAVVGGPTQNWRAITTRSCGPGGTCCRGPSKERPLLRAGAGHP